jgi:uncharacterized membrane protein HdeD (DUF308 family)
MKSILREQRRSSVLTALVTIVFGAILVMWPDRSVSLMCSLLGGALVICGVLYVIGWFGRKRQAGSPSLMVIPGVVLIGLGIWLVTSAGAVIALIQYVFGAVVIFHGILDLQGAVSLAGGHAKRWWLELLLALLTLGLGAAILVNPFGTFSALVMLIGCTLIYDGVSDLWLVWRLSRVFRTLEKAKEDDVIPSEDQEP